MTTYPWPKLDGPPKEAGWYWQQNDSPGYVGFREIDADDLASGWMSYPGTDWYGPIPPPMTGERKPAKAWRESEGWIEDMGDVLSSPAGYLAHVKWSIAAGAYEAHHKGGVICRAKSKAAAQLAAEDAIASRAWSDLKTIAGEG
jgi:hypothetical protein